MYGSLQSRESEGGEEEECMEPVELGS